MSDERSSEEGAGAYLEKKRSRELKLAQLLPLLRYNWDRDSEKEPDKF